MIKKVDAISKVENNPLTCQTNANTNANTNKQFDNVSNNCDYNNQINEDSFYKDNTTHDKKKHQKAYSA